VAAPEELVIRRLVLAKRDRKAEHLRPAALVFIQTREGLDAEYLRAMVRYERVEDVFRDMLALANSK
jgi:hypothetical protein